MEELPGELELRNRAYILGPQQKRIGWMVIGLIGVALAVAGFLLARLFTDPVVGDALSRFVAKRTTGSWQVAILLLGTLLLALEFGYLWLAARKERLFLDASGIRLRLPLPRMLQFLYPARQAPCSCCRPMRVNAASGPTRGWTRPSRHTRHRGRACAGCRR